MFSGGIILKRFLALFMSICVVLCSVFTAYAISDKVNLYYSSERLSDTQTRISLNIDLPENVAINGGIQLRIFYEYELFEVSDITSNYQLTINKDTIPNGYFNVIYESNNEIGINSDTTLLTFDVSYESSLSSGKYSFNITDIEITDSYLNQLEYTVDNNVPINASEVDATLEIDPSEIELDVGDTIDLKATITPSNYIYNKVIWYCDSTNVAEIDQNGKLTAKELGTAVVTAVTDTGIANICTVTVTNIKPRKIEISTLPLKTSYNEGDLFDDKGLQLKVTYEDNTVKYVKDGWTHNRPLPLTGLDHTVIISYRGVDTELEISINENSSSGNFSEIKVCNFPKTEYVLQVSTEEFNSELVENYIKNLSFDFSDLSITAVKLGGLELENYAEYSSGLIGVSFSRPHLGNNEIIVCFDGIYTKFDIFVDVVTLDVIQNPKTSFSILDKLDFSDLNIQLISYYYDIEMAGTIDTYEPIEITGADCDFIYDNISVGKNPVTAVFNYHGKDLIYDFEIEIYNNQKVGIEITSLPKQTVFPFGTTPNFSGLTVSAVYDDNTKRLIESSEYTVSYNKLTEGENTVTVMNGSFTAQFTINILPAPKISVLTNDVNGKPCSNYELPIKLVTDSGEAVKFSGIKLTVSYDSSVLSYVKNTYSKFQTASVSQKDRSVEINFKSGNVSVDSLESLFVCSFKANPGIENTSSNVTITLNELSIGEMSYPIKTDNNTAEVLITSHDRTPKLTKATLTKNGKNEIVCDNCSTVLSSKPIYYPKTISLSSTTTTYNGKVKTPTVTVKNSAGKYLVKNTDYTVTYASGRKSVGKYAVKVTFKGNYSGTKTLYFTIIPKKTSLSTLTAGSKKFTAKWLKQTTATSGYQIQYSTSSKFSSYKVVTVSSNKTTSKTISKLAKGKVYYVRIRTYKSVSGVKYVSGWSGYKKVKVK